MTRRQPRAFEFAPGPQLQEAERQAERAAAQAQHVEGPRLESQPELRGSVPRGATEGAQSQEKHGSCWGRARLGSARTLRTGRPASRPESCAGRGSRGEEALCALGLPQPRPDSRSTLAVKKPGSMRA